MSNPKIVLLAGKGFSTQVLYHALKNDFNIDAIVLEEPVAKKTFLKNRVKKLGAWKVVGQVLFQLIIVNFLNLIAARRKRAIVRQFNMNNAALPQEKVISVSSVNDDNCLHILQSIQPQLVIVNGTRIISKRILDGVSCPFVNMHAGITPKYRGVHGAYWALVNNDKNNCGVTIHLVDAGIDTGAVLYQKTIVPGPEDNFVTYPLLQLGEGIPYLKKAVEALLENRGVLMASAGESKLWYHPSLGQYLYNRIFKGKK